MNKKIYKKWWFWIIAIIVVVIVNDTFINPGGEEEKQANQIKIEEKAKTEKKDKKEEEKEINNSKLKQELEHNLTTIDLDYVEVIEITKDNETYLKVDVAYKNEMLNEGTVNAITKLTQKEFGEKYKDIKLKIIQEKPFNFIKYNYKNEKWNRES